MSKDIKEKSIKTTKTTTKTIRSKTVKISKAKNVVSNNQTASKSFENVKELIESKVKLFFEANTDETNKQLVSVAKLMEASAHIGLSNQQWNPKMSCFICKSKSKRFNTIDILKLIVLLSRAYNFIYDIAKNDGKILFVGTHNDNVKNYIKDEATRVGAFYVNQRWLGGTLTNFRTINNSITKLNNLNSLLQSKEIEKYTKKQKLEITKKAEKLEKFLGGIKEIKGLPQVIIVTDPILEHNAVKEAHDLHIPVVAIANTNANPNLIDFIIPANTCSIRTQWLIIAILADAIALAKDKEQKVVGKSDGEIVLPEVIKIPRKIVFTKNKWNNTFVNNNTTIENK